jgi:hypothetical protein
MPDSDIQALVCLIGVAQSMGEQHLDKTRLMAGSNGLSGASATMPCIISPRPSSQNPRGSAWRRCRSLRQRRAVNFGTTSEISYATDRHGGRVGEGPPKSGTGMASKRRRIGFSMMAGSRRPDAEARGQPFSCRRYSREGPTNGNSAQAAMALLFFNVAIRR